MKPFLACLHANEVWQQLWRRKKPQVVIDGGANIGGYTETFLIDGAIDVHCFEPSPRWFSQLATRFQDDPRVTLNPLGLGDHHETIRNLRTYNCHTLIPACDRRDEVPESIGQPTFDMDVVTLDQYCRDHEVCPDFVKIDVDGPEVQVLRGAREILARCRPPVVIEVSRLIEIFGDSPQSYWSAIEAIGYHATSMAGEQRITNLSDWLAVYPHDSSCDIMLIPSETVL